MQQGGQQFNQQERRLPGLSILDGRISSADLTASRFTLLGFKFNSAGSGVRGSIFTAATKIKIYTDLKKRFGPHQSKRTIDADVSDTALPNEVQQFILRYITSVEKLEILLLLSNSSDRTWSDAEVFQRIQSSLTSVRQRLKELESEGFLAAEQRDGPCFRFSPKSAELADDVEKLRVAYNTKRVKVVEAIFAAPSEVRLFADAFKLRKDK